MKRKHDTNKMNRIAANKEQAWKRQVSKAVKSRLIPVYVGAGKLPVEIKQLVTNYVTGKSKLHHNVRLPSDQSVAHLSK